MKSVSSPSFGAEALRARALRAARWTRARPRSRRFAPRYRSTREGRAARSPTPAWASPHITPPPFPPRRGVPSSARRGSKSASLSPPARERLEKSARDVARMPARDAHLARSDAADDASKIDAVAPGASAGSRAFAALADLSTRSPRKRARARAPFALTPRAPPPAEASVDSSDTIFGASVADDDAWPPPRRRAEVRARPPLGYRARSARPRGGGVPFAVPRRLFGNTAVFPTSHFYSCVFSLSPRGTPTLPPSSAPQDPPPPDRARPPHRAQRAFSTPTRPGPWRGRRPRTPPERRSAATRRHRVPDAGSASKPRGASADENDASSRPPPVPEASAAVAASAHVAAASAGRPPRTGSGIGAASPAGRLSPATPPQTSAAPPTLTRVSSEMYAFGNETMGYFSHPSATLEAESANGASDARKDAPMPDPSRPGDPAAVAAAAARRAAQTRKAAAAAAADSPVPRADSPAGRWTPLRVLTLRPALPRRRLADASARENNPRGHAHVPAVAVRRRIVRGGDDGARPPPNPSREGLAADSFDPVSGSAGSFLRFAAKTLAKSSKTARADRRAAPLSPAVPESGDAGTREPPTAARKTRNSPQPPEGARPGRARPRPPRTSARIFSTADAARPRPPPLRRIAPPPPPRTPPPPPPQHTTLEYAAALRAWAAANPRAAAEAGIDAAGIGADGEVAPAAARDADANDTPVETTTANAANASNAFPFPGGATGTRAAGLPTPSPPGSWSPAAAADAAAAAAYNAAGAPPFVASPVSYSPRRTHPRRRTPRNRRSRSTSQRRPSRGTTTISPPGTPSTPPPGTSSRPPSTRGRRRRIRSTRRTRTVRIARMPGSSPAPQRRRSAGARTSGIYPRIIRITTRGGRRHRAGAAGIGPPPDGSGTRRFEARATATRSRSAPGSARTPAPCSWDRAATGSARRREVRGRRTVWAARAARRAGGAGFRPAVGKLASAAEHARPWRRTLSRQAPRAARLCALGRESLMPDASDFDAGPARRPRPSGRAPRHQSLGGRRAKSIKVLTSTARGTRGSTRGGEPRTRPENAIRPGATTTRELTSADERAARRPSPERRRGEADPRRASA